MERGLHRAAAAARPWVALKVVSIELSQMIQLNLTGSTTAPSRSGVNHWADVTITGGTSSLAYGAMYGRSAVILSVLETVLIDISKGTATAGGGASPLKQIALEKQPSRLGRLPMTTTKLKVSSHGEGDSEQAVDDAPLSVWAVVTSLATMKKDPVRR